MEDRGLLEPTAQWLVALLENAAATETSHTLPEPPKPIGNSSQPSPHFWYHRSQRSHFDCWWNFQRSLNLILYRCCKCHQKQRLFLSSHGYQKCFPLVKSNWQLLGKKDWKLKFPRVQLPSTHSKAWMGRNGSKRSPKKAQHTPLATQHPFSPFCPYWTFL